MSVEHKLLRHKHFLGYFSFTLFVFFPVFYPQGLALKEKDTYDFDEYSDHFSPPTLFDR